MELQSLLVLGPGKAYQVRTHLVIIPHPHSLQKTSPLHPTQSRQEDPLKTRVFGAHIRSAICCGLPLSTGEVITPNSGYEGIPSTAWTFALQSAHYGRHVTKSAVPQASSPELRQFEKLLLCDAFLTAPRSQESSAVWFSLTVF